MRYRRLLLLAMCSALVTMLAGCASSPGNLSVGLKGSLAECRKLTPRLRTSEIGSESDYRHLSAEALGAISKGNKAITRRNRCDDKVIESYATAT